MSPWLIVSTYDKRNRLEAESWKDPTAVRADFTTKFVYDAASNLKVLYDAYDTSDEIVTTYDYDDLNRLTEEVTDTSRPVGDPASPNSRQVTERQSAYRYDLVGNLIESKDFATYSADQTGAHSRATFEYDSLYRLIEETYDADGIGATSTYHYDEIGNLVLQIDPTGRANRSEYDDLNQLVRSYLPDLINGGMTSIVDAFVYGPTGALVSQTNGDGETTRYYYDSLGRQIRTVDGNGDEMRSRYDSESNLISSTDAVQNSTLYAYDNLNRIQSETIVDDANNLLVRRYEYNQAGLLFKYTDRDNRGTNYTYDGFDELVEQGWFSSDSNFNPSNKVGELSWELDELGRVVYSKFNDRENSGQSFSLRYEEEFTYDNLGRLTSQQNDSTKTSSVVSPKVVQQYVYDDISGLGPNDFLKSTATQTLVDADKSFTSSFISDSLGRLIKISDDSTSAAGHNKTISFAYDAADRLKEIKRFVDLAGATDFSFDTRYGYDDAGRRGLTEHTRKGELSSFVSYAYNYDPASRIDSITTKYDNASVAAFVALPASRNRSFGFDDSGQLKTRSTDGLQDNSFAYDENGNRIDANDEAHSNMANNRLESDGEFNYEYDNEGNLTSRTSQSDSSHTDYTWDNGNRLTQIQQYESTGSLAKTITYRYNNDDLRVRKQVDVEGTTTGDFIEHYVYDGSQLVLTLDDLGNPLHRYTNGVGVDTLLIDEVFAAGAVTDTLWAANDHQGSVRELLATDANHTVVEHRDYDPFGELAELYDEAGTLEESGGKPDTAALDSAFAFAGREWDEEAQLYYNRARY